MTRKTLVPDTLMIPIGVEATKRIGTCADNWTDSDIAEMRAQLPVQYHAVPTDALRRQWINIRKRGTDGYRVNGHGPSVGSRSRKPTPQWYVDYLRSEWFQRYRQDILRIWGHRCAVCNSNGPVIDVHHRDYSRIGAETRTDAIAMCRACHELFESESRLAVAPDNRPHAVAKQLF